MKQFDWSASASKTILTYCRTLHDFNSNCDERNRLRLAFSKKRLSVTPPKNFACSFIWPHGAGTSQVAGAFFLYNLSNCIPRPTHTVRHVRNLRHGRLRFCSSHTHRNRIFNCRKNPTELEPIDLWIRPKKVAEFLFSSGDG